MKSLKNLKHLRSALSSSSICRWVALVVIILAFRAVLMSSFTEFNSIKFNSIVSLHNPPLKKKFIEVPQIVWGLNNQKIAFARACLTAKLLNRTLLMPLLSASLFYKEIDKLQPIPFDKIFQLEKFNSLCTGFVSVGRYSDLTNQTQLIELEKGSGRRWTAEQDMDQLIKFKSIQFDGYEVIRVNGKNPFLWHDHWPVKDYGKVFKCLVLVDEIAKEADHVVSRISSIIPRGSKTKNSSLSYVAVHMRIEIDWMIHCKKMEKRWNMTQICSSKAKIVERVGKIANLETPIAVYLAVADGLLDNDSSILSGWKEGLIPLGKKELGVDGIYKNYSYLIQAAIDYEVCLRADVFVGNSFSTFSSLVVLERTQKILNMGVKRSCGTDLRGSSYAYNILGDSNGPQRWMTDMSDSSFRTISYGSNNISC